MNFTFTTPTMTDQDESTLTDWISVVCLWVREFLDRTDHSLLTWCVSPTKSLSTMDSIISRVSLIGALLLFLRDQCDIEGVGTWIHCPNSDVSGILVRVSGTCC
jgi:hypothetical protein